MPRRRDGRALRPEWFIAVALGLALGLQPREAPATIEEQRARLPPPATGCEDDLVAGVWQAHTFYRHVGEWYRFELDIRRDPDDAGGRTLIGTIRSEFWDGGPERAQPPLCDAPGNRRAVLENARGRVDGLDVEFDATDWRGAGVCHTFFGGYLLDRFSGHIDPERMEFQSVLNADSDAWTDVPTVFRRVRCPPPSDRRDEPKVVVAPPPYEPPSETGCGFRD